MICYDIIYTDLGGSVNFRTPKILGGVCMGNKLPYEQPELTLRYFVFDGNIATISDVNSSNAPTESDNNIISAPESNDDWWGDW